ncbi:MAG: Rpn family recombination-promoting nuclease/putative transposase [bacterium]|nr:Rpn family recombination-promoting nuclease/putative transposase [bacterium]
MKDSKETSKASLRTVNPHDAFFKEVFTRREVAIDFFRRYLPADILEQIEPETLEYRKDSFVDRELQEYYSDLLFKIDLSDSSTAYLYILLEHKSYQDKGTACQLLRYIGNIWDMAKKNEEDTRYPVVIPVVLYHGESGWRYGTSLQAVVSYPDSFTRFLPDFEYVLCDASAYRDEEIRGTVTLQVALLLFRHIFREDLRERLPGILTLLRDLAQQQAGREFLETVIRYVLSAAPKNHLSRHDVQETVKNTIPQIGGEIMVTIADTLIEEGFEKGIEKGLEAGMQRGILQNAREDLFDVLEIRFLAVPQTLVKTIERVQETPILKILHRKAVQAESLEVFERFLREMLQ